MIPVFRRAIFFFKLTENVIFNFRKIDIDPLEQKYPRVTSPRSSDGPKPLDVTSINKLEEPVRPYGVFESDEELAHR